MKPSHSRRRTGHPHALPATFMNQARRVSVCLAVLLLLSPLSIAATELSPTTAPAPLNSAFRIPNSAFPLSTSTETTPPPEPTPCNSEFRIPNSAFPLSASTETTLPPETTPLNSEFRIPHSEFPSPSPSPETMPPTYTDIPDALPSEVADLLPDGLFSDSLDEAVEAAETVTDWQYLLSAVASAVGLRLSDAVGMLTTLVGLLLLAAVFSRLREGLGSGEMLGFCLRLSIYTALVTATAGMVGTVQAYFSAMDKISTALLPAIGTLYALGGNIGEAAVSGEVLAVFLAVCRYVSTAVTPPVCALCMVFALMDALGTRLSLSLPAAQIKKWYTGLLSLVMFLLSLALAAKSVLAGRADSWGMRGVKYAMGNWIPVVGGALGGTLGQVAAGVGLMRSVCGISGVLLLALTLLPTLVELLLFRAVLNLSVTFASLLGCDGEARLLGEMASLYGYLAAAVAISSVLLTLMLTLFLTGAVALG